MKMKKLINANFDQPDSLPPEFWKFRKKSDTLLFGINYKIFKLDQKMQISKLSDYTSQDMISVVGDKIFLTDTNKNVFEVSDSNLILNEHLKNLNIILSSQTEYVCVIDFENKKTKLYNANNDEFLWEKDGTNAFRSLVNSSILYKYKENNLTLFSFVNGATEWVFTIPEKYNQIIQPNNVWEFRASGIRTVIGAYKGVLWLVTTNYYVFGLDVLTGKEVAIIRQPDIYPAYWSEFEQLQCPFGDGVTIDHERGVLFGVFNEYYGEIDLNSDKYTYSIFDISESRKQHQVRMDRLMAWEGDFICFYEAFRSNRFGLFSRSKKEIIWSDEIPEVKNGFPAIKRVDYRNGRYYVLDGNNCLHVYAKD